MWGDGPETPESVTRDGRLLCLARNRAFPYLRVAAGDSGVRCHVGFVRRNFQLIRSIRGRDGPGDQFIFAGDVFDRPGGVFLGTTGGSCTTLTGNDKSGQTACNGTLNLAGGQIVIQGVDDTAALFGRGDAVPLSIVGGTGLYQNARGNGTVQVPPDVPNQTDANFVLNMTGG